MDKRKRDRLNAAGWDVGTAAQFLRMSDEEGAYVELKLVLSKALRDIRMQRKLTQLALAKRLKSSQSRVAKMEAADPGVSIDLLVRSLFKLGARSGDIARMLATSAKEGRRKLVARNIARRPEISSGHA
jgi:ParB-like chromosome segregation protein Spo0J